MKDVVVLSENWFSDVELFPLFDKDLIISIKGPFCQHPRPNVGNIPRLNLHFHDITEQICWNEVVWNPMHPDQAKEIVDFVHRHWEEFDRLVVHCEAGISRSPGVAIGLARYFDIGDENKLRDEFPHFNIHVAKLIWEECEKRNLSAMWPLKYGKNE